MAELVEGQTVLEEPEEWMVVWEDGISEFKKPSTSMDALLGTNIRKGIKFTVLAYYTPPGFTPSQELWGLVAKPGRINGAVWVAMVYAQQVRAIKVEKEIKNSFLVQCTLKDGQWEIILSGFYKNQAFYFQW